MRSLILTFLLLAAPALAAEVTDYVENCTQNARRALHIHDGRMLPGELPDAQRGTV